MVFLYKCSSKTSGNLVLPPDSNNNFLFDAFRGDDNNFAFPSDVIGETFTKLVLPANDDQSQFCLTGNFVKGSATIQLAQADCNANFGVICQTVPNSDSSCNGPNGYQKSSPLDLLLDPKLQATRKKSVALKKKKYKDMFRRLDQTGSFPALFSSLWHAGLPCFDTKGMTGKKDGEKGILRYCEWKGKPISCAAIFTKFPTEKGMCCSFNIRAAEEIFKGNTYPILVGQLQAADKNASIADSQLPKDYVRHVEPRTLPGRNKGLVLMLDAHSDLYTPGSVNSDYKGFLGLISPSGSFPFTLQESFEIRPGHKNVVALTGARVDADDGLRDLSIDQRNCLFKDENSGMKIHKNYTYSNCMFECALLYARDNLKHQLNSTYACIPWFFPSADDSITICDPWESVEFFKLMLNGIPDETCSSCLPDCNNMIYEESVFTVPFRRCDSSNVGVSWFCRLGDGKLPVPRKFAKQLIDEYTSNPIPPFVKSVLSNIRSYDSTVNGGDIFQQSPKTYDAYDEDIAVVQVYFKKSTVFQMGSQPRMTWIDYLSNVGGLLGLVLGMGIISFIELIWVCLRLIFRSAGWTEWIA